MILQFTVGDDLRRYAITGGQREYRGFIGGFSEYEPISLVHDDGAIRGKFHDGNLTYEGVTYEMPFSARLSSSIKRRFVMSKDGEEYGSVFFEPKERTHELTLRDGEHFTAFDWAEGSQIHVCICRREEQVAQFEARLRTFHPPVYKLYIPDENAAYAEELAFLMLYYLSFTLTYRSGKYGRRVEVNILPREKKYDPAWLREHFPEGSP